MSERAWVITTILEGERVYFVGMRPTMLGPSDCVWNHQRGIAARFPLRQAAQETAEAMRAGEVVSMWGHPERA